MAALNWGIAGAGRISTDFCLALKTLDKEEHCIKAVGARSKERAREFADKFDIEKHYGSYEELFSDEDVHVIYIGTINTTHKNLAVEALEHGKHVLCEKPAAMNSQDLETILECAKEKNLFFMEATWTRFMPIYRDVNKAIRHGAIGQIKAVTASFGFSAMDQVARVINPELGGSVMMDIGIYAVHFADIAFSGCTPERISATGFLARSGVDMTSSITFLYAGQAIAQLLVSGDVNLQNEAVIIGTKGQIVVKSPFWCPTRAEINEESKEYPLPATEFPTNFMNSAGLRYEAEHVKKCISEKKIESEIMNHDTSRRIMCLLENIITQIGQSK
eukprot:gene17436-19180_t